MRRFGLIPLLCLVVADPAFPDRLQAPPLEPVHGLSGIGTRRGGTNTKFMYQPPGPTGRSFSNSFNTKSNVAFRAHNLDNPSELLQTTSLYNNPWYWENVGTLEAEMLTGGSGAPVGDLSTGGYYNPKFYDQWSSLSGRRHSGTLTNALGQVGNRFPNAREQAEQDAVNRDTSRTWRPPEPGDTATESEEQQRLGMLHSNRTSLSAHRISAGLNADIDTWDEGHVDRVLGQGVANEAPVRYTGSALRGLGTMPRGRSTLDEGLSLYDVARLRDDRLNGRTSFGVGVPWATRFDSNRVTSAPDTNRVDQASVAPFSPRMDEVYAAMAERAASLYPSTVGLEQRLEAIDRDYRVLRGDLVTDLTGRRHIEAAVEMFGQNAAVPGVRTLGGSDEDDTQAEDAQPERPIDVLPEPIRWEDFDLLLRHGQRIDELSIGDGSRFDDLLAAGEHKLREGDYFIAERRFNRALRFTPGHPLALAGLGHAQLGAGLYLSSALTLQGLLGLQPEMIDVNYGPNVLPGSDDLDRAISVLSGYLQGDRDLDRYGFLLAYIGHQLGRPDLIEQGLDAMDRGEADAALIELLGSVWLETEDTP